MSRGGGERDWISTFSVCFLSVPTLIVVLFFLQGFGGITSTTYANNWGEYLVQVVGKRARWTS